MKIDRKKAKADGMTANEIAFIEAYLDKHGVSN